MANEMESLLRDHIKLQHHSGHMPGWYATGFDKAVSAMAEDINDFCSAALADNRPKSGEPYDTIRNWLLLARRQGEAIERDKAATTKMSAGK